VVHAVESRELRLVSTVVSEAAVLFVLGQMQEMSKLASEWGTVLVSLPLLS
jgi:hypothetical protein